MPQPIDFPPVSPNTPAPDPALVHAVLMIERTVDVVYGNAVGVARLAGMAVQDVPRICVSAGCRTLERMIEAYHALSREDGPGAMTETERRRRQQEIQAAAEGLAETLRNGVQAIAKLQATMPLTPTN
jgi:hypothetical protein